MTEFSSTTDLHDADQLVANLKDTGAIVLDRDTEFFTAEEWATLAKLGLESGLPYETVVIGDAGEPNQVEVGRLMTDIECPKVVNEPLSSKMLEILSAPRRMNYLKKFLGEDQLYIRRAQFNHMHKGSFIGRHVDQDSNPDYEISVVLQFGSAFEGGEFVIHLPDGRETVIEPTFQSTTITRCDYAHEVKTVHSGRRTSLVFFASKESGNNKRFAQSA